MKTTTDPFHPFVLQDILITTQHGMVITPAIVIEGTPFAYHLNRAGKGWVITDLPSGYPVKTNVALTTHQICAMVIMRAMGRNWREGVTA